MPRRKPELRGWDDSWVHRVNTAEPEAWVRAVLATPLLAAMQNPAVIEAALIPGSRMPSPKLSELPPFIAGMKFGEISEAIRRVLADRESEEPVAERRSDDRIAKDANLKTNRGLKALREKGALVQKGKRYRLSTEWGWKELTTRAFDVFIPGLASGTVELRNRFSRRKGRPYFEVGLWRKRARTPDFYYGIRLDAVLQGIVVEPKGTPRAPVPGQTGLRRTRDG